MCQVVTDANEIEEKNLKPIAPGIDRAFLDESGVALIKKYTHLGEKLFTTRGYQEYTDDLLEQMTHPFLADTIERAMRDPVQKLGLNDRIFGTMTLCLGQGIEPKNMALGAAAGIAYLLQNPIGNK